MLVGDLAWMHPGVLWGLGAVLVPILIHLLLRSRPRRVRFPALALMRAALTAGQRANRVRNLLLLALRAAVLALAALLLAGPTCASRPDPFRATGPLACVAVLDDSLSTLYRPRYDSHATLFDESRQAALALVDASAGWPKGSQVAVVRAGDDDVAAPWSSDTSVAAGALRAPTRPHVRPLGQALASAAQLLRAARPLAPHIVVFTDGTAAAWRDVRPSTLAGLEGLSLRVVTPPVEPRSDLGILAAVPPPGMQPATAAVPVRVTLAAAVLPGDCRLLVRRDNEVLDRLGPFHVPADGRLDVTVRLPPSPPGPHASR